MTGQAIPAESIGAVDFPVAKPATVGPIYPPIPNTIPLASDWRAPVPARVEVVDTSSGRPVVVAHVDVRAPHRAPGGYDVQAPQIAPIVVNDVAGRPQVDTREPFAAFAETQVTPAEPATLAQPVQQVQASTSVEVEFAIRIGEDEEEITQSYRDVFVQGDLLVFVALDGERLWLPKARESAEIVVRIGQTAHKIAVLPLTFTRNGEQYKMAIVSQTVQIP